MRRFGILASLTLAVVLPAAAHTFGLAPGTTPRACLTIGATTYRLAAAGEADVTVRVDPTATAPGLRFQLADRPEEADFVLVDDGVAPHCRAANAKDVSLAVGAAADLTVRLVDGSAPADYRIYVRSRWISPEAAAALFAAAHMPPRRLASGGRDRTN